MKHTHSCAPQAKSSSSSSLSILRGGGSPKDCAMAGPSSAWQCETASAASTVAAGCGASTAGTACAGCIREDAPPSGAACGTRVFRKGSWNLQMWRTASLCKWMAGTADTTQWQQVLGRRGSIHVTLPVTIFAHASKSRFTFVGPRPGQSANSSLDAEKSAAIDPNLGGEVVERTNSDGEGKGALSADTAFRTTLVWRSGRTVCLGQCDLPYACGVPTMCPSSPVSQSLDVRLVHPTQRCQCCSGRGDKVRAHRLLNAVCRFALVTVKVAGGRALGCHAGATGLCCCTNQVGV